MVCPHCSLGVKIEWNYTEAIEIIKGENDEIKGSEIEYGECPNCGKLIINLLKGKACRDKSGYRYSLVENVELEFNEIIYPKVSSGISNDFIPLKYFEDYSEAIRVQSISSKSAAALCRRVLQSILRDEYHIKKSSLSAEIKEFVQNEVIPSHITDAVDAVREIGNIAAHPSKDNSTGEIVNVEPGEAEWLIEVIEALFDFTFIQPKKLEQRKVELDLKLERIKKQNK